MISFSAGELYKVFYLKRSRTLWLMDVNDANLYYDMFPRGGIFLLLEAIKFDNIVIKGDYQTSKIMYNGMIYLLEHFDSDYNTYHVFERVSV